MIFAHCHYLLYAHCEDEYRVDYGGFVPNFIHPLIGSQGFA
jgi:hypothetical protein